MLLLSEKYFAGNRYYGLSFFFDTIVAPLLGIGLPLQYLFVDTVSSEKRFRELFWDAARDQDLILIASVGSKFLNRSFLSELKSRGKRIIVFYGESFRLWTPYDKSYKFYQKHYWYHDKVARTKRIGAYADVIVQWDQPNTDYPERTIFFPSLQSREVFYPAAVNGKTIDVSFIGTRDKAGRMDYIRACPGIVTAGGGMGVDRIGLDVYADLIRSSKLSLQVPHVFGDQDVVNGRITEIMYSRTALLHPDGPNIRKLFEPGEDFIPVKGPEDFANQVRYYLEHDDERERIARNGWLKATQRYSAAELWKLVEERL